ncbi:MAG: intradiol ring-cleavage dioxygenase [Actinomycetota bacterium]
MSPDDDLHDRGLAFDLTKMASLQRAQRMLGRRGALQIFAGAAAGLALVGCAGSDGPAGSTTSSAGSGGATSTTASGAASAAIPSETAGPFPGDGSNGPDVLSESGVVRSDIRSSFGPYSGTAEGVPLELSLRVVDAGSSAPIGGAAVYVWHCDRDGRYSLYSQGATDQNYLRGVQAADASGELEFITAFPGAYQGRWPHIHFEVFPNLAAAGDVDNQVATSQLALPQDACEEVYVTDGYATSARNLAGSSLDSDTVFRDGYSAQLASVSGDASAMRASLTIAV